MAKKEEAKAAPTIAEMDVNPAGDFTSEAPPGSEAAAGPAGSAVGGGPTVVKFVDEIDFRTVLSDIEKLKAEITALKEVKFNADARIKELSESIGELRNMSIQREQGAREAEAKVTRIDEIVKNVQPQIILTELQKREKEMEGTRAQLERTTMMLNETITQVREIQKAMERVRGITNILDVDKGLNTKIGKLESQLAIGERFSTKAEKLYYEIDKRMTDYAVMKEKVERLEGLSREMMKEFDEKKIKLGSAASVDDFNLFKNDVEARLRSLREDVESKAVARAPARQQQESEMTIEKPFSAEAERKEDGAGRVAELLKHRDDIKAMLTLLEEEYREGEITEKAFAEARKNNEVRLAEIEQEIREGSALPATPVRPVSAPEIKPPEPVPAPAPGAALQSEIAEAPPIPAARLPPEPAPEIVGHARKRHEMPKEEGPEELEAILDILTNLTQLHVQQRDLERMLNILARQYKQGVINEETYYDIKGKSEERLASLNARLSLIDNLSSQQKLFREEVKRLRKSKGELEALLGLLDKQKGEGLMNESSYIEAKANSSVKLGEIDKRMELLEQIIEKHIEGGGAKRRHEPEKGQQHPKKE